MKNKNLLSVILLVIVITSSLSPALANSQPKVTAEVQSQYSPVPEQPLRLKTFADRVAVKEGEIIKLKVWVESELIDSATVTVFFAEDRLALEGNNSTQVSLPMNSPVTFTFIGKNAGQSNILTYVSGIAKKTNKMITTSQQIKGLEVKGADQWWSKLFSNPLSGVFIGALLTFLTTLLNDYREQRRKKIQRNQWLVANLPAQLEANRLAVLNGRETDSESWMSNLLTEGYYTEIQQMIEQKHDRGDLAQALLEAGFRLRDYEYERSNNRLTSNKQDELAKKLTEVIEKLRKLSLRSG